MILKDALSWMKEEMKALPDGWWLGRRITLSCI
jgi:hypothetical protein